MRDMKKRDGKRNGKRGEISRGQYRLKKRTYILCGAASAATVLPACLTSYWAWRAASCGAGAECAVVFAVSWLLLVMAVTDIKYMIIPDRWVVLLGITALVSLIPAVNCFDAGIGQRSIGLFAVSAPMALINLIAGDCFGGGDIKLTGVCGFLLGWRRLMSVMIFVLLAAGVFAVMFFVVQQVKRKNRKQYFAFGPFICTGVILDIAFPRWGIWDFILL